MSVEFVHLRTHTEFSLKDSLIRIKPLIDAVLQYGMQAIAVTDFCNFFAAIKFYKAAVSKGIKPILGMEIEGYFEEPAVSSSLLLLCQNEIGYKNLTCLISKAYQEGQYQGRPRVNYAWLSEHNQGIIALSGGKAGVIGQALLNGNEDKAYTAAAFFSHHFPERFYIEIQRTGRHQEIEYNALAVSLAERLHLPIVATNEVCFLNKEDFDAHETRVCIHEGCTLADKRRKQDYSAEQFFRSPEEMRALFADIPQAIENTGLISKRCTVKLNLGQNYLPNFPIPSHCSVEEYLSNLSQQGLDARLQYISRNLSLDNIASKREHYEERLKIELDVINKMGFAGYFLIVADFIQWAKSNDVPVGPGRGSGAGSLVAYALKITDLDPLQYDLLFERFLNPERISMPDFDIDFCMEGRDKVIEYVAEKYGRQSVSQIITFGTMAAKAVVRDVGRALGHPYGFVDKIAKLIPFELGITLQKALKDEVELQTRYEQEEEVKELIDLALKLEGLTRNAGKHAGGVVIAPSHLTDYTAIYCEEGSTQLVSQFDKDDVEAAGLVKFDFLGLRTLTIIDWALKIVNQHQKAKNEDLIDILLIPMDDPLTFSLLKSCQTTAVFQLESRGMKELIGRLQPDCFEDIIALVALFRPGPLQSGMVDDFINRKHGRATVEYWHADLEPILKPTYGVILYQEQVMQIAQVLANFTLGGADLLRRGMGKKKPEEMSKLRAAFIAGAIAREVQESLAAYIFDLMEKFAGYGFNKSHSAAYALLAYQTAWLKAHYPAAFMAAVLSADMDNTDKVVNFINECKALKIQVLPPSIHTSELKFTVGEGNTILFGLGAIKGIGESAVNVIIAERQVKPFTGLFNFCQRLDLRKVNKRVLEALIKSGAMDSWHIDRGILLGNIEKALKKAETEQYKAHCGQGDLFHLFEEENKTEDYSECKSFTLDQKLNGEKETLGYYISGHPFSFYAQEFDMHLKKIIDLQHFVNKTVFIGGQIQQVRKITTKRGKKLIILRIEDETGAIDAVLYEEIVEGFTALQTGHLIMIEGEIGADNFTGGIKLTGTRLYTIADARTHLGKALLLLVSSEQEAAIPLLKTLLQAYPGHCKVHMRYSNHLTTVTLKFAIAWSIHPEEELLIALKDLLGENSVMMVYNNCD